MALEDDRVARVDDREDADAEMKALLSAVLTGILPVIMLEEPLAVLLMVGSPAVISATDVAELEPVDKTEETLSADPWGTDALMLLETGKIPVLDAVATPSEDLRTLEF